MARETVATLTFRALDEADPAVAELIRREYRRQSDTLELIPSENLASPAILEALGTLLTNKYAEGYPGRRYYGGCQVMDEIESLAQERARRLFGAQYVNVQPHSVDPETEMIDYEAVRRQAEQVRPRLLMVGYSAYPRAIDFARMREIADSVGAVMVTDMAHFAGLVAGGAYPSPIPDSHIVTSTTQKTLRGAWGGLILAADLEWQKALDSAVFPGTQGGPLMHAIAAKAVCFGEALKPEFRDYVRRVVDNAQVMADRLKERGLRLVSGGTDNHLMLIDLRPLGLRGRPVQEAADQVGITLNRNAVPYDEAPPYNPSGIRLGSPSVTTRGMGPAEMREIADCVADLLEALVEQRGAAALEEIRERTLDLTRRFPLPYTFV